jgi:hypothetical protein
MVSASLFLGVGTALALRGLLLIALFAGPALMGEPDPDIRLWSADLKAPPGHRTTVAITFQSKKSEKGQLKTCFLFRYCDTVSELNNVF